MKPSESINKNPTKTELNSVADIQIQHKLNEFHNSSILVSHENVLNVLKCDLNTHHHEKKGEICVLIAERIEFRKIKVFFFHISLIKF